MTGCNRAHKSNQSNFLQFDSFDLCARLQPVIVVVLCALELFQQKNAQLIGAQRHQLASMHSMLPRNRQSQK
jgi:hypothetical protein